jgi:Arc/MetJ-type ribon-helix-helix transcriptional regulator
MRGSRGVRVNIVLTGDIQKLISRAITGGGYGSVSEYVRALIVKERLQSGDRKAKGVSARIPVGRPKAA